MVQDLCIGHLPRDAPSCKKTAVELGMWRGVKTHPGWLVTTRIPWDFCRKGRGILESNQKKTWLLHCCWGKHPKMCNPTILFQFSTILPHRRPGRDTSIDITYVTCKYRMWCEGGTTVHRPFHLLKAGLSFMNLSSCLLNTWSPNTWPLDLYGPSNKPVYHA